jgi:Zn-dependent protease with chaperone function
MDGKKVIISLLFLTISAALIMLFWEQPILLILGLIFVAYGKHLVLPIEKELTWFIIIGFLGAMFENIIIYSGAWYYPQVFFIHIPLWLPFVWGVAGTTGVSFYKGIVEKV